MWLISNSLSFRRQRRFSLRNSYCTKAKFVRLIEVGVDSLPPTFGDAVVTANRRSHSWHILSKCVVAKHGQVAFRCVVGFPPFDTFFVTKTENYQADGVLFKGNLRGDPKESYARMQRRCKARPVPRC